MDCSDLQRLLSIFFFLFSFTYSHVVNRMRDETLDLKYKQKIIDRIGFVPVAHNRSIMEKIRRTVPYPIARRINRQNHQQPAPPPEYSHEVMAIGTHVPRCVQSMASACFVFRISEDLQYLKEAILWIDLRVDSAFAGHQISIHEVRYINKMVQVKESLGAPIRVPTRSGSTESIARDVTNTVKRWSRQARLINRNLLSRAIAIICDDCNFEGISPVLDDRVIMELSIHPRNKRNKRSQGGGRNNFMNVCGYIPISCCLQRYSLNFARVGWDSWVVYPPEFTPNYCMGSCDGNVLPQTQHASMLAAAVRRMNNLSPRQRNSMLPCCAPTSMGSFTLMYLDPNGKVQLNQMNNLVAFDCGCM